MGILLTIAYDGTNYNGWQIQKNGVTVCGALSEALTQVLGGENFSVLGASRTDAGVHALGQRVHLMTEGETRVPLEKLPQVINSALPRDIAVNDAIIVSDSFHPIRDAKSKTYVYKIHNHLHRNPLMWRYSAQVKTPLNLKMMQSACEYFVGEHDFAAFCSTGSSVNSTVRTIYSLSISENDGLMEICINGNGFLYNMVRIIAGTLVEVGGGKIHPNQIPEIMKAKDRTQAGKTMPPQGLTLVEVFY
ncbi:MAG: tRNA pseudouridine(38-40) synthase TruA [Defluviitaleaceae bacterium]|nr:tRNA pseudouridine(38-40) synthase TruA [Defluviitaleaceae bacterium]